MNASVAREQALDNAAAILTDTVRMQAAMTPRQQAEGAWCPGHPLGTVEAIEQAVIERRRRHAAILAERDAHAAGRVGVVRDGGKWEDAATNGIGL